jgi:hypothetical protein
MSFGPPRDRVHTFQRLDRNPRWQGIPPLDEAGPRAVAAYFATYGPATPEHLQYWLGNGLSAGRQRITSWFAQLSDELVEVDVEGTRTYVLRDHVDALEAAVPSEAVRFLPGHDQWVIGPGTKDGHVTPPARRDLMTRKANPVVVGGVVRGTWVRRGEELTLTWLDGRRPPVKAIEREARRLADLVGRELHLDLGA